MDDGESCLASSQTQEVFYHDCSWSIATAVAMIAVIIALMKRHQREAAGNAMNNGTLVCKEWRGERELISRTGLLTAAHP